MKRYIGIILALSLFIFQCNSKNKNKFLPIALGALTSVQGSGGLANEKGIISGTVKDSSDNVLSDVEVSIDVRGTNFNTKSGTDGTFLLEVSGVTRGDGFNTNFKKSGYEVATKSTIFELANLRVDLGTIKMTILTGVSSISASNGTGSSSSTSAGVTTRTVIGKVIDDFSGNGLSSVAVGIAVPDGTSIAATTDSTGSFSVRSEKFNLNSSYTITLTKTNYITRSDVSVSISGDSSKPTGDPIRLFKNYGIISGKIYDDATGSPLVGVTVTSTDSKGNIITATTDANGDYTLTSSNNAFYVGTDYSVSYTKSGSATVTKTVTISSNGTNAVQPFELKITGVIKGTTGTATCGSITLTAYDSSNSQVVSTSATGGSSYTLQSDLFKKGQAYTVKATGSSGCENAEASVTSMAEGDNTLNITMPLKVTCGGGNTCITGVIVDNFDNTIKLTASVKVTDQGGVVRTATADSSGAFSVAGSFTKDSSYNFEFSMSNYTGNTDPLKETKSVTINVLAGQTQAIVGNIALYPIGFSATINGTVYNFNNFTKQSYEKFLTEKWGFTLSARDKTDLNTANSFYLHVDDTIAFPSSIPGGWKYVNYIPINGSVVRGAIAEWTSSDTRPGVRTSSDTLNPSHPVMYCFYVVTAGTFTIETTGSTDTSIKLYNSAGTQVTSSNTGGTPTINGKITNQSLSTGWYFIEVNGETTSIYGVFDIKVTGTAQSNGSTGTWNTNDLILSYYSHADKTMYIAGSDESGSSGVITFTNNGSVGNISRGTFSGTLRAINASGATLPVTNGYFNVIRKE